MDIRFVKSAVDARGYPHSGRPEVALVGRSNSGKSSFINALASSRKQISFVSTQPGKTRAIQFFDVGEHYTLVDMPGYGFAARSRSERQAWKQQVEQYLLERENLVGLLLIMDIRRSWTQQEQDLLMWVRHRGCPMLLILNKMDKEGRSFRSRKQREMARIVGDEAVFLTSAQKGLGVKELERFYFENWVRSLS